MSDEQLHNMNDGLTVELPPEEKKTTTVKKTPYYIALCIIGLAIFVGGLFIFWSVQPSTILVIKNNPVPATVGILNGDREVSAKVNYCKTTHSTGVFTYDFISKSTDIAAPSTEVTSPKECKDGAPLVIPVPKQAVADTYRIHFTVTYKINPIKTTVVQWDTQDFKVPGL